MKKRVYVYITVFIHNNYTTSRRSQMQLKWGWWVDYLVTKTEVNITSLRTGMRPMKEWAKGQVQGISSRGLPSRGISGGSSCQ